MNLISFESESDEDSIPTSDTIDSNPESSDSGTDNKVIFSNNESLSALVALFICWPHLLCALSWQNCQLVF
ncbi:hypothetical protein O181_073326 [Austropuccinia psidii MF-1]|uniref:Uncharacterized protein n=1 Tax=Austropuccinia psidii MF-1 TaxID=1389203 RepID=A0A9Q3F4E0_9BASI|nr:hypothetical protein [Austropuccinia psidii MF-1]